MPGHTCFDLLGRRLASLFFATVSEKLAGEVKRDFLAVDRSPSTQFRERAFEVADVRVDTRCNERGDVDRQRDALVPGLAFDDGHAGFDVRWLNVCYQAPTEAITQAFFEAVDFTGELVRRQDDLTAGVVESVEQVKELFLRSFATGKELNVVDDQHVDASHPLLELAHAVAGDRVDQAIRERVGADELNTLRGVAFDDCVADGVDEMGLTEPHASEYEKWIVQRSRATGDGDGGRARELIVRSNDETGKVVSRDQSAGARATRSFGRLLPGCRLIEQARLYSSGAPDVGQGKEFSLGRGFVGERELESNLPARRGRPSRRELLGEVVADPRSYQPVGHGKLHGAAVACQRLERGDPGLEILMRKATFQLLCYLAPETAQLRSRKR